MVTEQDLEQERKNINRLKQVQRSYMEKKAARYALLKEKFELKKLVDDLTKDFLDDEDN